MEVSAADTHYPCPRSARLLVVGTSSQSLVSLKDPDRWTDGWETRAEVCWDLAVSAELATKIRSCADPQCVRNCIALAALLSAHSWSSASRPGSDRPLGVIIENRRDNDVAIMYFCPVTDMGVLRFRCLPSGHWHPPLETNSLVPSQPETTCTPSSEVVCVTSCVTASTTALTTPSLTVPLVSDYVVLDSATLLFGTCEQTCHRPQTARVVRIVRVNVNVQNLCIYSHQLLPGTVFCIALYIPFRWCLWTQSCLVQPGTSVLLLSATQPCAS